MSEGRPCCVPFVTVLASLSITNHELPGVREHVFPKPLYS